MKRTFVVAFLFLLTVALAAPAQARTYAAIVVDEKSGAVLHAANPDKRVYPASLTKMMTLYLVFEALKENKLTLGQMLTVSRRAARRPKSKLRLKRGRTISVRDAIGTLGYASVPTCRDDLDPDRTDTQLIDTELPASGQGYVYSITAEGGVGDEGSLGTMSCAERSNYSPCP